MVACHFLEEPREDSELVKQIKKNRKHDVANQCLPLLSTYDTKWNKIIIVLYQIYTDTSFLLHRQSLFSPAPCENLLNQLSVRFVWVQELAERLLVQG